MVHYIHPAIVYLGGATGWSTNNYKTSLIPRWSLVLNKSENTEALNQFIKVNAINIMHEEGTKC